MTHVALKSTPSAQFLLKRVFVAPTAGGGTVTS